MKILKIAPLWLLVSFGAIAVVSGGMYLVSSNLNTQDTQPRPPSTSLAAKQDAPPRSNLSSPRITSSTTTAPVTSYSETSRARVATSASEYQPLPVTAAQPINSLARTPAKSPSTASSSGRKQSVNTAHSALSPASSVPADTAASGNSMPNGFPNAYAAMNGPVLEVGPGQTVPAALAPPNPSFTADQQALADDLAEEFVQAVTPTPSSSAEDSERTWADAQRWSDDLFRLHYGTAAYMQQHKAAYLAAQANASNP